jgi:hypothetical protein
MLVFAPKRAEEETTLADLAITKLVTLAARAPHSDNDHLTVANRLRVAQAKDPRALKVGGENLSALRRPLCRNDEYEDAAGNQPPESVIQEYCLKPFARASRKCPVVGRILVDQGEGLNRTMGFQTVPLYDPIQQRGSLLNPVRVEFYSVTAGAGISGDSGERYTFPDARIQSGERLAREL